MHSKHILLVAVVVALACGSAFAAEPPAPPDNWTEGWVLANGIRIHYWRTGGDKPPLIMAHGSSDNGLCWTALAQELEADFDVIMPDARGHGYSDPPSQSDPADAQAEDLAGLIRALELEQPIVMGHSMGSSASAWFAAKYPDVPRAVVLEDPGLVPRTAGAGPAGAATDTESRQARILARNNTSFDDLVEGCVKSSPSWGRTECEIWAPSKRLHHPNTAYPRNGERPAMSELFGEIVVPTLILKADAESDVRQQNEEVARLLKNGKIVHIDGAGHNVRREQKQLLLDALQPFLASLE